MSVIKSLQDEIYKLETKIKIIQTECSHPPVARIDKPGGNTGNYDPTADSYWVDYHCTLCDKKWTVYSE